MNIIIINYNWFAFVFVFILVVVVVTAEAAAAPFSDPEAELCFNNDNTTDYSENVDLVLTQLESATEHLTFNYTSSYNPHSNKSINGMAQCMGNSSQSECSSCVKNATSAIREMLKSSSSNNECQKKSTDVYVWYNPCFLRYRMKNFFGSVDSTSVYLLNTEKVTASKDFNRTLTELITNISTEAVKPVLKFMGKGSSLVVNLKTKKSADRIYGLVQCTQDLSAKDCESCLAQATANFYGTCLNRKGCRILFGSCVVRYEIYPF